MKLERFLILAGLLSELQNWVDGEDIYKYLCVHLDISVISKETVTADIKTVEKEF